MGGQGVKVTEHQRTPLCREDHRTLHEGYWSFSIEGDFYVGRHGGDFRSPRALSDEDADKRFWTLEHLCREWHAAEEEAVYAYRVQCQVAWALKERFEWQPEWYEHAAALLSRDEEKPVHWQRVYERVKDWEVFELELGGGAVWERVWLLGQRGRLAVAKHEDHQWALDTAMDARLGGSTITEIERLLRGGTSSGTQEKERCVCGEGEGCGHVHSKKGEG
jgi:hypothetical protein